MRYEANSPEEYISQLPVDRRAAIEKLRKLSKKLWNWSEKGKEIKGIDPLGV